MSRLTGCREPSRKCCLVSCTWTKPLAPRGSLFADTSTIPYTLTPWMLSTAGTTLFIQVKASSSVQLGFCSDTTTTRSSRSTVTENTAIRPLCTKECGSTAITVAMRSSVLWRRPPMGMSPSSVPQMKTSPPVPTNPSRPLRT